MDSKFDSTSRLRTLQGGWHADASIGGDNKGPDIVWSETIKKEARGIEDFDLGEVQAVEPHFVKTEKGVVKRETFYLPRVCAEAFDGSTLWFVVTSEHAETEFRRDTPPTEEEYAKYLFLDRHRYLLAYGRGITE
jgi:hypothetical protein